MIEAIVLVWVGWKIFGLARDKNRSRLWVLLGAAAVIGGTLAVGGIVTLTGAPELWARGAGIAGGGLGGLLAYRTVKNLTRLRSKWDIVAGAP